MGNDEQFARLCEVLGLPELKERFPRNAQRVEHRQEVVEALSQRLRTKPRAHWLELLRSAGVPAAPVNDLREAFQDPQAEARGAVWTLAHPLPGTLPPPAHPLRFLSRTPAGPGLPPPLLGEHTREVLLEAGYTSEAVADLIQRGIAKEAPPASQRRPDQGA